MQTLWQPSASLNNLQLRAKLLQKIRQFFAERNVLEVETPLLCHTSATDPFIQSIPALVQYTATQKPLTYFLQTSPEYAMKRLLAAGSGAIYQICKAFRQGEIGRFHNPEFTMLEWYRPQFDHHQLMAEMDELLTYILHTQPAKKWRYDQLFKHYLSIDIYQTSLQTLALCAKHQGLNIEEGISDIDTWLQVLMSHIIEPQLGHDAPYFVYDFPVTQAALARIQPGNPPCASRFEVYIKGVELANGFHELQDASEQRQRFMQNLNQRKALGLEELPIDENFLAALQHGLPDCAGVALGIDRLIMIAANSQDIKEILSFDFNRV